MKVVCAKSPFLGRNLKRMAPDFGDDYIRVPDGARSAPDAQVDLGSADALIDSLDSPIGLAILRQIVSR